MFQRAKNLAYARTQSYEAVVPLDTLAQVRICEELERESHLAPIPQMTIESDASQLGWGLSVTTRGRGHINAHKLSGVAGAFLAVKTFVKDCTTQQPSRM